MSQATQEQVTTQPDPYLTRFESFEKEGAGGEPAWLYPIRKAGISRFAEQGFPTLRDEDWRFTNVSSITKLPFKPAIHPSQDGVTADAIKGATWGGLDVTRLVFVNGHFNESLSSFRPLPDGVRVGNLAAELARDHSVVKDHLTGQIRGEENAFTALNTAFFQDGGFVYVPKETVVEEPIHLIFISTARETGVTSHPRNLIVADRHSQLRVIESYVGLNEAAYLTNAVTEFVIGDEANVEHCKLQNESPDSFHMASMYSRQGRSSRFHYHTFSVGARLSRNNLRTTLDGEGCECVLNGLYMTKETQLADNYMIVDHAKPHCESHEYFNGVMDGRSHGVFHGRILVRPNAQKTDAKQENKNLLLSDNAVINTKPQLEIYADDVKCTHGATCGQMHRDAIFYLRARGLSYRQARRMLTHAFAGEIVGRVKMSEVRDELDRLVWDRLEELPQIAEDVE